MAPPPLSLIDEVTNPPQKKQTNDSERDPDSSPPPHGDGERRRHDLLAQLPYDTHGEREGKAPRGRVAAAHLVCAVCV